MKPVILTITNDIVSDRRIFRIAGTLQNAGYNVLIVGRKKPGSLPLEEYPYPARRFSMIFTKGFFFYAFFSIRLFFYLLFTPSSLLVANDLDTLLPVFLISVIKRVPVIYDTHEYFTGVPEVENRPLVKSIWLGIEQLIFPRLKYITTVNGSIASLYREKYNVPIHVVRNLAPHFQADPLPAKDMSLSSGENMVIIQGTGINTGRGAEEAVLAMQYLSNVVLFIVGNGNAIPVLQKLIRKYNLANKVRLIPTQPYYRLMRYTAAADLGLTLDKPGFINFKFSLPNKLFDFIQAGIPVLASDLPEVAYIIREYGLGDIITSHDPREIAEKIKMMVNDTEMQKIWRQNARKASMELCWEKEEKIILELYAKVLPRGR